MNRGIYTKAAKNFFGLAFLSTRKMGRAEICRHTARKMRPLARKTSSPCLLSPRSQGIFGIILRLLGSLAILLVIAVFMLLSGHVCILIVFFRYAFLIVVVLVLMLMLGGILVVGAAIGHIHPVNHIGGHFCTGSRLLTATQLISTEPIPELYLRNHTSRRLMLGFAGNQLIFFWVVSAVCRGKEQITVTRLALGKVL